MLGRYAAGRAILLRIVAMLNNDGEEVGLGLGLDWGNLKPIRASVPRH
jgi:hypothetical protein